MKKPKFLEFSSSNQQSNIPVVCITQDLYNNEESDEDDIDVLPVSFCVSLYI